MRLLTQPLHDLQDMRGLSTFLQVIEIHEVQYPELLEVGSFIRISRILAACSDSHSYCNLQMIGSEKSCPPLRSYQMGI